TDKSFSPAARQQLTAVLLGPPKVSIDQITSSEPSPTSLIAKLVTFTLRLTHPSSNVVTVKATTFDGSAKARTTSNPGDYLGAIVPVTFPAGVSQATFTVGVLPDTLSEGDEFFFAELSQPTNATLSIYSSGSCTIHNNSSTRGGFDLAPNDKTLIP